MSENHPPCEKRSFHVGVAMDERFLAHKTGHAHPEQPRRLAAIYRMIDREFRDRVKILRPEPATVEQVESVHTPGHVRRVLQTATQHISSMAPDTQVSAESYMAAWLAAGACLQGIDRLMDNTLDAFFALVRPPGHHAQAAKAEGFCIFNNIAIAARYAMTAYGITRILVVDWDIHHGNGINDLFYNDCRLYYYSTHDTSLYPYTGFAGDTGEGAGLGCTMNIPLARKMNDDDIVCLYGHTLLPVLSGYKPELIMVAAGFDAHADDPVGKCDFTESIYGRITGLIMNYFTRAAKPIPPLFFALEGGYDLRALTCSIQSVLTVLLNCGILPEDPPGKTSPETRAIIREVLEIHKQYGVIGHD